MTGPEHYRTAEILIEAARDLGLNAAEVAKSLGNPDADIIKAIAQVLAEAQVHATLALAAATAQNIERNNARANVAADTWTEVLGS